MFWSALGTYCVHSAMSKDDLYVNSDKWNAVKYNC